MFEETVLAAGTALLIVGMGCEAAFLYLYLRQGVAFHSAIGIMFVLMSSSTLLTGLAIVLGRLLGPDYFARPLLTMCIYAVFAWSMVWKLLVYIHESSQPRFEQGNPVREHWLAARRRPRRKGPANTGPVPIYSGGTDDR